MKIIRGELTTDSVSPAGQRYDATCNCIQVTTDGGSTWVEAVGQDPRTQPAYLKPPVAGSTKRCDASANMVAWIKGIVDQLIALLTGGAQALLLANSVLQIIEGIFPFAGYFIQLMYELAVDVVGTGAIDLNAAFDAATYDALLCIFYCHADDNGQISPDAYTAIGGAIVAQLNTTAALIVSEILIITGFVGLSNAGATGSTTGDCTDCTACFHAYEWDFHVSDGLFVHDPTIAFTGGVWVGDPTHGYEKSATGTFPPYDCGRKSVDFDVPATCHIISLAFTLDSQSTSLNSHMEGWIGTDRANGFSRHPYFYTDHWGASETNTGDVTNQAGVHVAFDFQGDDGSGDFYKIRIDWTGDEPIGLTGGEYV